MSSPKTITTTAGNPLSSNQYSLTAGPRGPLLMADYQLLEKLAHQNRERIPERPVHAKGSGAHGTLTITGISLLIHTLMCYNPTQRPIASFVSRQWLVSWGQLMRSVTCEDSP